MELENCKLKIVNRTAKWNLKIENQKLDLKIENWLKIEFNFQSGHYCTQTCFIDKNQHKKHYQ